MIVVASLEQSSDFVRQTVVMSYLILDDELSRMHGSAEQTEEISFSFTSGLWNFLSPFL